MRVMMKPSAEISIPERPEAVSPEGGVVLTHSRPSVIYSSSIMINFSVNPEKQTGRDVSDRILLLIYWTVLALYWIGSKSNSKRR
jgi:hypothetical protein